MATTSQKEYSLHFQSTRTLHIKIEILNDNDRVINRIEGVSLSGSISVDGKSTYRRNGSLKMLVNGNNVIPKPNSNIWFNRKVKISVGIESFSNETVWFNQGIFLIKNANIHLSESENIITLDLADNMASLDGTLDGTLSHEIKILPQGIAINEAIRSVVTQLGKLSIDDISVNGNSATLPYELSSEPNSNIHSLIKELTDLYMGYEFFFDVNGYFRIQKIRDTKSDAIAWDFTQNHMDLTIDYSNKMDFTNVKNSIWVWGKKRDDGVQVSWVYRNKYARETIQERNTISDNAKGDLCHVISEGRTYLWNGSAWELLDFTVVPEFNIESIGERKHVFSEDKVFNEDQARLRAEYELAQKNNFAETISISCVPIYFLQTNTKIRLNVPEVNIMGDYRIDSFSIPLDMDGEMSITATKIYY